MNRRIWIAAGTTEGRRLAEELARKNWEIFVTVATEYGASLVEAGEHVTVFDKRLDEADMRRFLDDCAPDLVVDATHPYAAVVTETLRRVCAACSGRKEMRRNACAFRPLKQLQTGWDGRKGRFF